MSDKPSVTRAKKLYAKLTEEMDRFALDKGCVVYTTINETDAYGYGDDSVCIVFSREDSRLVFICDVVSQASSWHYVVRGFGNSQFGNLLEDSITIDRISPGANLDEPLTEDFHHPLSLMLHYKKSQSWYEWAIQL